ncbi:peptide chain release factor 2 [Spelaeicoccus albus]
MREETATIRGSSRDCRNLKIIMVAFDFASEISSLRSTFESIRLASNVDVLRQEVAELTDEAASPHLWDDPEAAQKVTSKLSHKQSALERLEKFEGRIDDAELLAELAGDDGDQDAMADAVKEVETLRRELGDLEIATLLSGPYDERDAVVTIRSGAGGVDAADFAEMLMRMYLRWAERKDYGREVLDTSYAEEAGLKSATFQISAPYAYGTLSVEAGTHRLVRISPFDNQGRRQTSFAAVEVVPLIETTDHIEIPENDLRIDVFRSSGPGGQSVNTTDSAVRITHIPTGTVVSMQNEKSQIQNRAAGMRVLQSRLLELKRREEEATKKQLAGDVKASWGDQMRSYVTHPYQMVKDLRTGYEVNNPSAVFDGDIEGFLEAGIRWRKEQEQQSADA